MFWMDLEGNKIINQKLNKRFQISIEKPSICIGFNALALLLVSIKKG